MASLEIKDSPQLVAEYVAKLSVELLNEAISKNGYAIWLLAGGSTPLLAYSIIAQDYADALDYSKLWLVIGDERVNQADGNDSNWAQISQVLLDKLPFNRQQLLRPDYEFSSEAAAENYALSLKSLPNYSSRPQFDLVWLGIGEDGHTLSLFPRQVTLQSSLIVVPVHDAPKPPPDRISLTLEALSSTKQCYVIATGEAKAEAVNGAMKPNNGLPVALAVKQIEDSGGTVNWLLDREAASLLESA